jgi:hypothetical protein
MPCFEFIEKGRELQKKKTKILLKNNKNKKI